MADMTKGLKGIWMKSMEAISDTASRIATNTKYKVNEMNIVNRRAEILKDFGAKSYALWQKGEQFPAELDELLAELHQLETELSAIRAEKVVSKPAAPVAPAEAPAEEPKSFEEKMEELEEKTEDALESIGDSIEDAAEELKEKILGDDDEIEETSETMQQLLESVVADGSGNRAYIEGYAIGGKTATSQTLPRSANKYISSFLGFAPADDPQVIGVCIIRDPQGIYYGGTIAAPVLQDIYNNILPYLGIEKNQVAEFSEDA